MRVFLAKAHKQFIQKLPFVLYCKPNSEKIIGVFQENDTLYELNDYNQNGFVFSSFDYSKRYIIPDSKSLTTTTTRLKKELFINNYLADNGNPTTKEEFISLVTKGIEAINNKEFQKVVLSRKELVMATDFNFEVVFENLVQLYPEAFVYCYYHPKIGFWMGASPEQLLRINKDRFETIALAGTQKDVGNSEIIWKNKEIKEQQLVTDYILDKLAGVASDVVATPPYSVKAGTIWHIKTNISGVLNYSNSSLQQLVELLHPTPAVCGFPKAIAKDFILENEKYDRSFYTGFLGELNSNLSTESEVSDLFVNLRCMEVDLDSNENETKIYLYIGCGITQESVPEKEWEESVDKSMSMKRALFEM